jgi:uncharacterized protein (TIGR02270 family)
MILPKILTQHAEEAAFLWLLRDGAVGAPHYELWELAKIDNRVEAHLDGLRVAGDDGWQFVLKELEDHPEPGETFAAAVLAFESGNQARIKRALDAGAAAPENGRGLVSALGWLPDAVANEHINYLLLAESPAHRRFGLAACAILRRHPGPHLEAGLRSDDPALRSRALKAAGEFGDLAMLPLVRSRLGDDDPACRFHAAWSAALLIGDTAAVHALQDLAVVPGRYQLRAVQLAVRRLDPQAAHRWLTVLAQLPTAARAALVGAGALGDVAAVPRLLEAMKDLPLARLAGEAFEFITGADIAYEDLDRKPPEGFEAGPTENPSDDNVDPDPDTYLPWPDPDKVAAWWAKRASGFPRNSRYLLGKPIAADWLRQVLKDGRQRQRAAAALELALLRPGQPLYEVRAPGFRQPSPPG